MGTKEEEKLSMGRYKSFWKMTTESLLSILTRRNSGDFLNSNNDFITVLSPLLDLLLPILCV